MAALQNALQTLSPIDAVSVPESPSGLDTFLNTTFDTSQLLIDSVPLPAPASLPNRPRSSTTTSIASSASEITLSSARPDSPPPDVSKLQKAWGKPLRLAAKDNPLGMSVYKLAGTDGKGAWFARRSVHCGLGFERWKRALQQEFPETMKVDGGPGVGNIRGIGGERCVECREAGGGKLEVYHLSAQFPGPTTPRDFVTMLMTTERTEEGGPRQFMIVSKPCIHPQTPEREGFIRGQYQSVELIREVPVLPSRTKSASMNDLAVAGQPKKPKQERKRAESQTSSLGRDAVLRNANSSHPAPDEHGIDAPAPAPAAGQTPPVRTPSEDTRRRGHTISFAGSRGTDAKGEYHDIPADDPERNPVEWIMLTRSDPGGLVPRFMVERGTPGSIVADAAKFLNWACSAALDVAGDEVPPRVDSAAESPAESETELVHPVVAGEEPRPRPPPAPPRAHPPPRASTEISLREFQTNGHLAGLDGLRDPPPNEHYAPPITDASLSPAESNNKGVLSMVSNAASAITNFLPSSGYAAALPHALPRDRRYSTSSSSSEGETDPGSPSGGSFVSFTSARERGSYDDADESADAASVPPMHGVPAPLGQSQLKGLKILLFNSLLIHSPTQYIKALMMPNYLKTGSPSTAASSSSAPTNVPSVVSSVIEDIRNNGDSAVRSYSKKFDKWSPPSFKLSLQEIKDIISSLPEQVIKDIKEVQCNVRTFAQAQKESLKEFELEIHPGVFLGQKNVPINSVGCYIPGGRYPLLASAHMTILTAKVAGVPHVMGFTPPINGSIPAATVAAMAMAGADAIYILGGVQAIAGMAIGTDTIPKVDFIAGPGNAFVAEAKRQFFGAVGIDLFAGPTEVLIIADEFADSFTVATDLLSQAEHGPDTPAVLITTSESLGKEVIRLINVILKYMPTRELAGTSWRDFGEVAVVENLDEAYKLGDTYASEHVQILTKEPRVALEKMTNYGALFLGEKTCVSYGDKVIGTNHVLPTRGAARYTGGLWVGKYLKTVTYQEVKSDKASGELGQLCGRAARVEKFEGHARSGDVRAHRFLNDPYEWIDVAKAGAGTGSVGKL